MEEWESQFQGVDNTMGFLDLQAMNLELINGWQQLLTSQGFGDFGTLQQAFEVNLPPPQSLEHPGLQSSNPFPTPLGNTALTPSAAAIFPEIPNASSSFTFSEAFSPSERMFPSLPASPIGLFEPPQYPSHSTTDLLDLHGGLNAAPSLLLPGDFEMIEMRQPEHQSPRRQSRRGKRPDGWMPAKRRIAERYEICGFCKKGFPFKADLQKHIDARHTSEPDKPKYHCTVPLCTKVYTRSDRLYRHGVSKHGWPPGGAKRKGKAVDGGQRQ
ncbi:hypothetical protein B0T16DRAFT_213447 [Cercophora newfieldiana]|uniref:C2H2-type domain-containing protein n=1 Tax=Cercophora newfieldiana TaxID=92897 RepID=A0AA39XW13_9PEZI|nr:hypothetical protein B0T16DRAFT_213447 [Cercophora newfieldiana]